MILPDVNVLVYAFDEDSIHHERYKTWLQATLDSDSSFGLADLVLSGFLRIVTHPRILAKPASIEKALTFTQVLRSHPNCIVIRPGNRHWDIFVRLCNQVEAKGNGVPDAYFAALAIESGSEFITADKGFARFPGLRWRHPLA